MGLDIAANYHPSPGQLAFHRDRHSVRERLLTTGTGGGKTYAVGYEVLDITFREPPGVAVLAAPDFPQLRTSVWPTFERLLGHKLHGLQPYARWNKTDKELKWWNGWTWVFASMDDPRSVEGIPDAVLVWLNEARLVRDFGGDDGAWPNLTRRLRGQEKRPRYAIADTHSPTREIMEQFKAHHVDAHATGGGEYEVIHCEDPERRAYQWSTASAMAWGTLDEGDGERIMRAYHGAARKRIVEGRYALLEGLVFEQYDPKRHLVAAAKMHPRHVSPRGGVDFGWDVTALTLTVDTGSRRHTVWEARLEHATLSEMSAAMKRVEERWGRVPWTAGPDRPDSCKELRDMGHDVKPAKPTKVMDGVGLLQQDLASLEWLIDPSCHNVRQDLENYVIDKKTQEPAKSQYDAHFLDAIRYERVMASRKTGFAVG